MMMMIHYAIAMILIGESLMMNMLKIKVTMTRNLNDIIVNFTTLKNRSRTLGDQVVWFVEVHHTPPLGIGGL